MSELSRIGVYLYPHHVEWLRRQQKPAQPWLPQTPASEIIRELIEEAMFDEQMQGQQG